jgi:hypothetical protein
MEKNMSETDPKASNAAKGERKYFQLTCDFAPTAPLRTWANEKKLMEWFPGDSKLPFHGLQFSEPPKIAFDRKKRRGALLDAYPIPLSIWLVSDRLKSLLEELDPAAFVFVRAEVDYSNFDEPGPGYWFCDFVRMLDCIDDERSRVTYYEDAPFKAYRALIDVKMRPEVVGDAHAFRLTRADLTQVVDDVFVKAIKAHKIRGIRFIDIQK